MNALGYVNILKRNVAAVSADLGLPSCKIFQEDGDPKHSPRLGKDWLLDNTPKLIDHPPQSNDLNPIERIWDYLDRQIEKSPVSTKEGLKASILEEWRKIPPEYTKNLVESMPRRLNCVT